MLMKKLYTLLTLCLVSILTAGLSFAQKVLTSVDELSNSKVYTLVTPRATLAGGKSGISTPTDSLDATDANQQFAIYKGEKGYYLYCLGTNNFINFSGTSVFENSKATSCYTIEYLSADTCFAIYNLDKSCRYNFNGESNSIMNEWGTATKGNTDAGNKFALTEVGDLDEATATSIAGPVAIFDKYTPISPVNGVASIADLSNNKAYYIFAKDTNRGFWGYDEASSTEHLTATSVSNTLVNNNLKFAILKSERGNYYVYSIAAKKFVTKSGDGTGLSSFPIADSTRVITVNESDAAPFVIAIDGSHIGISPYYTALGGIISNWQDLNDGGNRVGFVDAGEFDPTEALEYIDAQETMLMTVSQTPALDSICAAIPDVVEVTLNKAIVDLPADTKVIVHAVSSFRYEEIEGAEVTVQRDSISNRKLIFTIGNKEAFTKDGQYSLSIEEVVAEDGTVDDVEATFMVTGIEPEVPQNTFIYSSVTPNETTPTAELSYITITYPAIVGFVKNDEVLDVLDADSNVVAQATIDFGMEWEDVAITLINPINENGVYTITIPEGTIYDENAIMEDDDTWDVSDCIYNPEFTIKVLVDTSTGIKKVEVVNEKSRIFTLDGKKVNNTLKKGVYIVNGKKVVK